MIDRWSPALRPQKARARHLVLDGVPKARAALFLPSAECFCIRKALEVNAIDRRTHVVAVERDAAIARRMGQTLRRLKLAATVCQTPLHRVTLDRSLDLAFIDLNGGLDKATARWLGQHLAVHLRPNATVIVIMAYSWRNNQYLPHMHKTLLATAEAQIGSMADELECSNYDIVLTVALFRQLFQGWSFKTDFRLKYQDDRSVPMSAYRFYDFKPRPPPRRSAAEMSDRSAAANQAWETRHKKVTPRTPKKPVPVPAQQRKLAASAAALKAWATRRRNGWVHPASR